MGVSEVRRPKQVKEENNKFNRLLCRWLRGTSGEEGYPGRICNYRNGGRSDFFSQREAVSVEGVEDRAERRLWQSVCTHGNWPADLAAHPPHRRYLCKAPNMLG